MSEVVRVSAVSYLNTKPYIYGLQHAVQQGLPIIVSEDIPSACADKLIHGHADIGLLPVGALHQVPNATIIPGFGIGAVGPVQTVMLYAQVPVEEITTVVLDYQSRTSVRLVQLLFRDHFKCSPQFVAAQPGFENDINGTTAAVVIGDRTFSLNGKYPHEYDLAYEWYKHTGLGFAFAVWVSTRQLSAEVLQQFTSALSYGVDHIDEVIAEWQPIYPSVNLKKYLTQDIKHRFSREIELGMKLFLEQINA